MFPCRVESWRARRKERKRAAAQAARDNQPVKRLPLESRPIVEDPDAGENLGKRRSDQATGR